MIDKRSRPFEERAGASRTESYDSWLRERIAGSLAGPRPPIPQAKVDRRMAARLKALATSASFQFKSKHDSR